MNTDRLQLVAGTAIAEAVAACSADGEPLKRIQLLPIGEITSARDGRKWRVRDLAHAERIVEASKATAGATDIPIDYDHQLVYGQGKGNGGTAPASGWIKTMAAEPTGIWADVEWTEPATAKLRAREYRYISPYFGHQPSGDITRIYHAGLTNFPAITDLAAVASADPTGDTMDLKALAAAHGLPETATMDDILAAAKSTKAQAAAAAAVLKPVAKALGLAEDSSPEVVATAAAAVKAKGEPDPKAFVPMASFKELQTEVATLRGQGEAAAATAAVDAAIEGGKITPAGRDHALKLYRADKAAFADFVGAQPAIVTAGAEKKGAAAADLDAPLSPEEKVAASAVGISEEDFKKSRKQVLGAN